MYGIVAQNHCFNYVPTSQVVSKMSWMRKAKGVSQPVGMVTGKEVPRRRFQLLAIPAGHQRTVSGGHLSLNHQV